MTYILWGLLALMWGSAFAGIKVAIESIEPVPLVAARMILAALIMVSYLYWRGRALSLSVKIWFSYFIVAMLSNIFPYLLITYAEHHVDSGLAAIFMGATPIFVVLLAPLIIPDEVYTPSSILGIILGFIGVVILVGGEALNHLGDDVPHQIMIIIAALCYGASTVYVRRFVTQRPLEMTAGSMFIGAISIGIIGILQGSFSNLHSPSYASLMAMLYLGIFPTALAAILYFHLVKVMGASPLSMINFAVPIVGAAIGILYFNEVLHYTTLIALGFICLAVYLVNRRKMA